MVTTRKLWYNIYAMTETTMMTIIGMMTMTTMMTTTGMMTATTMMTTATFWLGARGAEV